MRKRFVIYGMVGLCMELFWTGMGSLMNGNLRLIGQSNIWMFFIYGLAVFLEPIHIMLVNLPVLLRGGIYTLLIFITEYFTGWLLQLGIGICPWCYVDALNVNNLITLSFIPIWFIVGILFEKLHYFLSRIYLKNTNT
ncbi:MAG: hypothetical protein H7Y18_07555 [Clostridiaceae bacterium]|nr:hypothetical protein [Clostridiaceae bacterium]